MCIGVSDVFRNPRNKFPGRTAAISSWSHPSQKEQYRVILPTGKDPPSSASFIIDNIAPNQIPSAFLQIYHKGKQCFQGTIQSRLNVHYYSRKQPAPRFILFEISILDGLLALGYTQNESNKVADPRLRVSLKRKMDKRGFRTKSRERK